MALNNPFKDAGYEKLPMSTMWRRVLAEFIGTTLFVYVVSASAVIPAAYLSSDPATGDLITAFIQGLGLAAIVAIFAGISGGHFNPAITLTLTITRALSPILCIAYMLAQIVGAILGAAILKGSVGNPETLGATTLQNGITNGQGFLMEFMITNILLFVVVATTADEDNALFLAPIPIGFAVLVGVLIAKTLTGGSMNPARAFGPSVVSGVWTNHWIYWVAPLCSAIFVGVIFKSIFDRPSKRRSAAPRNRQDSDCTANYNESKNKEGYNTHGNREKNYANVGGDLENQKPGYDAHGIQGQAEDQANPQDARGYHGNSQ